MSVSIENILKALHDSWSSDTCFVAAEWSLENPARGQCVVSSLVVQEFLGGDLIRYQINGPGFEEMHYANILPDQTILDTTGSQYTAPVSLTVLPVDLKGFSSIREKRLADPTTRKRYDRLLMRVSNHLYQ